MSEIDPSCSHIHKKLNSHTFTIKSDVNIQRNLSTSNSAQTLDTYVLHAHALLSTSTSFMARLAASERHVFRVRFAQCCAKRRRRRKRKKNFSLYANETLNFKAAPMSTIHTMWNRAKKCQRQLSIVNFSALCSAFFEQKLTNNLSKNFLLKY